MEEGESFVIMQADKPIAKLKLASSVKQLRPFGLCAGEFTVPDDFDAPYVYVPQHDKSIYSNRLQYIYQ